MRSNPRKSPDKHSSTVALIRCDDYEIHNVTAAVERGIVLLGGSERFIKRGETILLKPNLLMPASPETAVNTHPALFEAVASVFKESGARLTFGDSAAIGGTSIAARKAGLLQVARRLEIPQADFRRLVEVDVQNGLQHKKFRIARGVTEASGVISLPKMKTHGLMRITGAVKNQYGCLPGIQKGEYHLKMQLRAEFARLLVDLTHCIKPRLYVMDGICAMEGSGPRSGDPKWMKVILLSEDPIALDTVFAHLINLPPRYVPTIIAGEEAKLGTSENLVLVGNSLEELKDKQFKIERSPVREFKRGRAGNLFRNLLIQKPRIDREKCVRCGKCVTACPTKPKSLEFTDEKRTVPPAFNYDLCIRCYCCYEVCPERAISLKAPLKIKRG